MDFYLFRVLFPALLIDIALTATFLWKENLRRGKIARVAFAAAPLYVLAALIWIIILGVSDPRFKGQGVLGLILLWGLGLVFTFIRSLLGLILYLSLRHR